jgi:serine protease AprX
MAFKQRAAASPKRLSWRPLMACLTAAVLLAPSSVSAQGRRARLSEDLANHLRTGGDTTCVILPGSQGQIDTLATRHGLRVRKRLAAGALVDVPAASLPSLVEDAGVASLSGNYRLGAHMAVTTEAIGADQVWQDGWAPGMRGLTGAGVGVAVIDSGVAEVPELRGRIVVSVDFTASSKKTGQAVRGNADCNTSSGGVISRPGDENGHGTHVAGIIAAAGARKKDSTRGVAPGAHIISLKVLDADGGGYAGDVVEAIEWAIANRERFRIRVLNMSLGGPVLQAYADDPVNQAVERAYRSGLVVIASAGNRGKDAEGREVLGGVTVPGNSPFAITVGAVNTKGTAFRSDDEITTYSSRGPTRFDHLIKPDLVAPGNKIVGLLAPGSTLAREFPELVIDTVEGKRLQLSGTSMASAVGAGTSALVLQGLPNFPPFAVRLGQAVSMRWAH